jgi:hypothetical protein
MPQPPEVEPTETTYLVWICQQCRMACKVQPEVVKPGCRCDKPVPGFRPTRETQMHAPKRRPMHAITDEEGRLRALARKNQRVRVTFEAEVVQTMLTTGMNGMQQISFIVATPDGRRHAVDPNLAAVHIEAADAAEDEE